jgi:hypothetical protein
MVSLGLLDRQAALPSSYFESGGLTAGTRSTSWPTEAASPRPRFRLIYKSERGAVYEREAR